MEMLGVEKGVDPMTCWSCQKKNDKGFFCDQCGKVQPVPPHSDYFSFLGFPRTLELDGKKLENTFHQLSRKFHPDFFYNKSEPEKKLSLENTAFLNSAYRTLRDFIARAEYLLELEGEALQKNQTQPPADLFDEIFEIQETLEEFRDAHDGPEDHGEVLKSKLQEEKKGLEGKQGVLEERLKALFKEWDQLQEGLSPSMERKTLLKKMREILSHRSYMITIIRDLDRGLAGP